jgi:hypothetical protein
MPIMIQMVTKAEFAAWTEQAREEFAGTPAPATVVAGAEPAESASSVTVAAAPQSK